MPLDILVNDTTARCGRFCADAGQQQTNQSLYPLHGVTRYIAMTREHSIGEGVHFHVILVFHVPQPLSPHKNNLGKDIVTFIILHILIHTRYAQYSVCAHNHSR